jgi:hypothetical protein
MVSLQKWPVDTLKNEVDQMFELSVPQDDDIPWE